MDSIFPPKCAKVNVGGMFYTFKEPLMIFFLSVYSGPYQGGGDNSKEGQKLQNCSQAERTDDVSIF